MTTFQLRLLILLVLLVSFSCALSAGNPFNDGNNLIPISFDDNSGILEIGDKELRFFDNLPYSEALAVSRENALHRISYRDLGAVQVQPRPSNTANTCDSESTCTTEEENKFLNFWVKFSYYPYVEWKWLTTLLQWMGIDEETIFPSKQREREHRTITVQLKNQTLQFATDLQAVIRNRAHLTHKTRRFLVVINPTSGPRQALHRWKMQVSKMFAEANIESDVLISKYAKYITEVISGKHHDSIKAIPHDLIEYDAIIALGGDGTLSEVLNGILALPNSWEILQKVALQPLPSGSGNALSKSILFSREESPALINAVYNIIKGQPFPKNLAQVVIAKQPHYRDAPDPFPLIPSKTSDNKVVYSSLAMVFGILADLDIRSDHLRFLGELRFYIYALYYAAVHKQYAARLRMNLLPETRGADEEERWITIGSDKFSFITVLQASHLSESVQFGPGVGLDDSFFTVIVGEDLSRWQLLESLIKADVGFHTTLPNVKRYHCTEYYIEPLPLPKKGEEGWMDVIYSLDGERIDAVPMHGIILPNAANILLLPQR